MDAEGPRIRPGEPVIEGIGERRGNPRPTVRTSLHELVREKEPKGTASLHDLLGTRSGRCGGDQEARL